MQSEKGTRSRKDNVGMEGDLRPEVHGKGTRSRKDNDGMEGDSRPEMHEKLK